MRAADRVEAEAEGRSWPQGDGQTLDRGQGGGAPRPDLATHPGMAGNVLQLDPLINTDL